MDRYACTIYTYHSLGLQFCTPSLEYLKSIYALHMFTHICLFHFAINPWIL